MERDHDRESAMITKFIEAQSEEGNWGKFLIGWFDADEQDRPSQILPGSLLTNVGWDPGQILVLDLQTCEGVILPHGGHAHNDLAKHKIWVCPLFEPFLEWLYEQQPLAIDNLPDVVKLSGVPLQLAGYRRPGSDAEEISKAGERRPFTDSDIPEGSVFEPPNLTATETWREHKGLDYDDEGR